MPGVGGLEGADIYLDCVVGGGDGVLKRNTKPMIR